MTTGQSNNPILIEAGANTGSTTRTGTLVVEVDGVAYQIPLSQIAASAVTYNFIVSASPSGCTVLINDSVRTNNTYACPAGTEVRWSVSKSGYVTQSGTYTMTAANHTETVTLVAATLSVSLSGGSGSSSITIPTFAYDADSYSEGASFYINANQPWTLTKPSWCTIYGDTTSGSGTAILRVYPSSVNSGSSARTGAITVTGTYGGTATINLTQNYNTTALQLITVKCGTGTGDTDEVAMNDSCAFYEVYTPSGTTDTGVTWSIVSMTTPGSCTGQMIDYGGDSYFTVAINGSASIGDTITVRATSTAVSGKYGEKTVTVTSDAGVIEDLPESITVSGSTTVFTPSNQAQYTATVSPATAPSGVTWSLLYAGSLASIDQSGLLTVYSNANTATPIRVVATSTADNSVSGYLDVYIRYKT